MRGHFFLCSILCFGRPCKKNLLLYLKSNLLFFFIILGWITDITPLQAYYTLDLLFKFANVSVSFYGFFLSWYYFSPWSIPQSSQKRSKIIYLIWAVSTESLISPPSLQLTRLPFICVVGDTFSLSNLIYR